MQVGAWPFVWAKPGLFTYVDDLGKELEQLAGGLVCTGEAFAGEGTEMQELVVCVQGQ